jgi:hypothetical protein
VLGPISGAAVLDEGVSLGHGRAGRSWFSVVSYLPAEHARPALVQNVEQAEADLPPSWLPCVKDRSNWNALALEVHAIGSHVGSHHRPTLGGSEPTGKGQVHVDSGM